MYGAVLNSFTYENSGGNGAGVIILNDEITDSEKQKISAEIGLSETAFIKQIDETNFDLSFFTPLCQVDLCGHATIAAFFYLGLEGIIKGFNETKKVYQRTKAGVLEIDISFKDSLPEYVLMQQSEPEIFGELEGDDAAKIARSLNIEENQIGLEGHDIKAAIVSTGLKDIIIPVKSKDILNNIQADLKLIEDFSIEKDVVGYHVYSMEGKNLYARNFAPAVGINEECATGTSNGALGSLLFIKRIISGNMEVIQGESMNQKSLIFVQVSENNHTLDVRVGGKASILKNLYF
nr:PhzF family phenazine biosynthesis protein [Sedimentibacter sp.]